MVASGGTSRESMDGLFMSVASALHSFIGTPSGSRANMWSMGEKTGKKNTLDLLITSKKNEIH